MGEPLTEREKMGRSKLYDANNDPKLLEARVRAKDLCFEFNQLRPSDAAGQAALLRQLLGRAKGTRTSPPT